MIVSMKYNDATSGPAHNLRAQVKDILSTSLEFFENEVVEGRRANRAILNVVVRGIEAFASLPLDQIERLSPKRISHLDVASQGFLHVLRPAFDSRHSGDNVSEARLADILRSLRAWESDFYDSILENAAMLRTLNESGNEWQAKMDEEADAFRIVIAQKLAAAEEIHRRIEALREDIAKTASTQKVSSQSDHFLDESSEHNAVAKSWLMQSYVLFGAILAFAILSLFAQRWIISDKSNVYEWIHLGISKAFFFSILVYALFAAIRSFNASIHNSVVNKHRSNALSTYTTIAEAVRDLDKRDIILTKAAECIFDPQPTGFTKESGSESSSPTLLNVNTGGIKPNVGG